MGGRGVGIVGGGMGGTVCAAHAVVVLATVVSVGGSDINATDVSSEARGRAPRVASTESAICGPAEVSS